MSASMSGSLASASGFVRAIYGKRPKVDASDFLNFALLITAVSLALTIRLLSFRYGFYLSEFDPYWHYRSAQYIADNGIVPFLLWRDTMSWVPGGRAVAASTPIGLPLFAASFEFFLKLIGISIDLMSLAILIPPISGIFAALSVYYFAKELASREAGIVSAILIAFNGSNIERTDLGFFKHETLGIPLIVLTLLFFIKAVKADDEKRIWLFSILSGLSLGYLAITWTGYVYMVGLIALVTVALTLFSLVDPSKMLVVFSIVQGIFLTMGSVFPRSQSEMLSINLAISLAAFGSILLKREMDKTRSIKAKISLIAGAFAIAGLLVLVGVQVGFLSALYGKLAAILNPALRAEQAIVESVSEHKMSTWFTLFNDHGPLLLLFGFCLVSSVMSLTVDNIFILLAGGTSLYFSTMMVRLGLIFSPFSCSLSAVGGQRLIAGVFPESVEAAPADMRRAKKRTGALGFSWVALSVLLVAGLLAPSVVSGLAHAGAPVTLAGATLPFSGSWPDWPEALAWMRENTPPGSVVMSWWDYGYWITTLGDRPTIIDNATINSTQVAMVGRAFISNDSVSLPIMKRLNVSYVVVFSDLGLEYGYRNYYNSSIGYWGDEVKWIWMAEIGYSLRTEPSHNATYFAFGDIIPTGDGHFKAGNFTSQLVTESLIASSSGYPNIVLPKPDFVLTKLLILGSYGAISGLISDDPHFTLAFRSSDRLVMIFKVNYDIEKQMYSTLTASSTDNDTSKWTLTDSDGFWAGSRVTFTIADAKNTTGSYSVNDTSFSLGSAYYIEILDSKGQVVSSIVPTVGTTTLDISANKILLSGEGGRETEIPVNFTGTLRLSFRVQADKPPTGISATIVRAATARLVITSIKIGLTPPPS